MSLVQKMFASMRTSSTGMLAERARIDVIAQNIAHADVTRMPDGSGPYRRQQVRFEPLLVKAADGSRTSNGVRVAAIQADTQTPFEIVHDPSHPDADAQGNVAYPNVNATQEMADMILAMRSYEANLNAQDTFVRMAERALRLAQ